MTNSTGCESLLRPYAIGVAERVRVTRLEGVPSGYRPSGGRFRVFGREACPVERPFELQAQEFQAAGLQ